MSRVPGICICLLWLNFAAVWADDWRGYRFYKPVQRAEAVEQILGIGIDGPVFTVIRDGMPDIRVANRAGLETPYVLEKQISERFQSARRYRRVQVKGLQKKPDDSLEITLKLSEDTPSADGLRLHTSLKNFEHQVRVFGSSDGTEWVERVSGTPIYDYARYMDVSNLEIDLPGGDDRHFKLLILEVTDDQESPLRELTRTSNSAGQTQREERTRSVRRDFRIDSIEAWWNIRDRKTSRVVDRQYALSDLKVTADTEQKRTLVEFKSNRAPLSRFLLEASNRNFSRSVLVQVLEQPGTGGAFAGPQWRDIGSGTVSRVRFREFQRQQLGVTFAEQRQDAYRLIIENGDSQPLDVTAVVAEGPVYHAIIMAEAQQEYRLYYGAAIGEAPSYDAFNVQAQLPAGVRAVDATLGAQVRNPTFQVGSGSGFAANWLSNRVTLGVAITLMVLVLGWALVRSGQRVKQLPVDED